MRRSDANHARETVQLLQQETPDFISRSVLPNRQVDYRICGLMQERVHIIQQHLSVTPAAVTSDLKQRLIDTWPSISQNVIDKAVGQWRKRLRASMKEK